MKRQIPNLLTGLRLALCLFMFVALAAAAGSVPWLSERLTGPDRASLERWAVVAFVVAAVTDFFDGWLARRWNVTSLWGAILDPIADKVLVCGAVLGLLALAPGSFVVLPCALILFREFTVSALREVAAGKNIRLPVTMLAKWKTTLQLAALTGELVLASWAAFGLPDDPHILGPAALLIHATLWLAAIITVITGAQYWEQARKALEAEESPSS
jgi:CDP-diacylglycerol--glycerol-3-phosphate 3-phosphatidyltransferase